jgi:riboflavin synthase
LFSGIVEAVGSVLAATPAGEGLRISVAAPTFDDLALGASICVSGVCLTVVDLTDGRFDAEISPETLRRSTLGALREGSRVNLERSLRLSDRLSGHLVFGHVDGIGRVRSVTPESDSALVRFEAPPEVDRYLVEKGSVAIDGVSLTVFDCADGGFTVAVIPHTAAVTTLGGFRPGSAVNLEADMIGKYVEKLASPYRHR